MISISFVCRAGKHGSLAEEIFHLGMATMISRLSQWNAATCSHDDSEF